jgi:non-ribosomal peptide synthetase component E (peptide arylation enzyme)
MDNLGRLLVEKFESISDAPALNDTGGTLSYRVLAGEALKVANVLNSLGVSEDEPVLVPVGNEARDVSALIGVWLAGGVVETESLGRLHIDHKLPAATCIGPREPHSKAKEHSGR